MNEIRWQDIDALSPGAVTASLNEQVRSLFFQVCILDGGCSLLRLLNTKRNSVMTADDIAYHLNQTPAVVERNLRRLVDLNWVRRVAMADCTWFGLTTDSQKQEIVRELLVWQDRWFARLEEMKLVVTGAAFQPSSRV